MFNKLTISFIIGLSSAQFSSSVLSDESDNAANTIPDDQIVTVLANSSSSSTILGGTILPIKMVNLIAQMPGEVKFIAGEEGDAFKTGTSLVGLDQSTLIEKRRAALAGLNSARAGLANAKVQYKRESESPNSMSNSMLGGAPSMFSMFNDPMREMTGQGNPDYERYSSMYGQGVQIQTAKDQIEQAKAGISELEANLDNLNSIAPFNGIIVKKMVEVGDIVQPGMPLVVFADVSIMQVQVEVPSRLVDSLSLDSLVSARLERNGKIFPVKVSRIFPMANQGGHTTTVKFQLPTKIKARPGTYAEILIPKNTNGSKKVAVIPKSAISWRGSLPSVFEVSEDKTRLKMRAVRLGSAANEGMVSVMSGVEIGDKVLKTPLASTRSGLYKK